MINDDQSVNALCIGLLDLLHHEVIDLNEVLVFSHQSLIGVVSSSHIIAQVSLIILMRKRE